MNIKRARLLDM